ncbi:uncharacterized protein LOC111062947 [Nilaparvata lugens]|uniref:uncharacterized protein LOC111062947 n=1 Tax=Nilaparvata lugens TaxID=108931 RepID=UPI00193CA48D|nr:uncharacterized protein LOC111062947 [Nilaparvata lugens]
MQLQAYHSPSTRIYSPYYECTRKNLKENPGLSQDVIKQLICESPPFDATNQQLSAISKNVVSNLLHELLKPTEERSSGDSSSEITLLSLISLADDKECLTFLESQCNLLCKLCSRGRLSLCRVLVAAASQSDLHLYERLVEAGDSRHYRTVNCLKRLDSITISKIYSEILKEGNRLNVSELYLRTVKNKVHWIEDLMGLCSQLLLYSEQWSAVDKLIDHPLFDKLKPILVFELWNTAIQRSKLSLICLVLDCCKGDDPVLNRLYETLEWLSFIVEWVEKESESHIADVNALLLPAKRCTVLHMLKTMCDITKLDSDQVKQFLTKAHQKQNRNENIETESAIFDGFCILTSILELVVIESKLSNKRDKIPAPKNTSKVPNVDDSLSELEKKIGGLNPLYFRLEILENIFSLLFLRSEDFREDPISDSGAEDDDRVIRDSSLNMFSPERQNTFETSFKETKLAVNMGMTSQSLPPIGEVHSPQISRSDLPLYASPPVRRTLSTSNLASESKTKEERKKKTNILERGEGFLCNGTLVKKLILLVKNCVDNFDCTSDGYHEIQESFQRLNRAVEDGLWRLEMLSLDTEHTHRAETPAPPCQTEWTNILERGEGFLCNGTLVKKLILLVKNCVDNFDCTSDGYHEIQESFQRLNRAVEDGLWRLEMLSLDTEHTHRAETPAPPCQTEWVYNASEGSDSDPETSQSIPFQRQTSVRRSKRTATESTDKSSESGSNTGGSSNLNPKIRKIRKRKNSRKSSVPVSCTLINLMLSSEKSLVTYFLARKDVAKAVDVIQRFKLEDSSIAIEVKFINSFADLKGKLATVKRSFPNETSLQKDSTLKTINEAASSGLFVASLTSELERFWSTTMLPEVGCKDYCRGLVVLDLALTLDASLGHSETLLSIASKYISMNTQKGGNVGASLEKFITGLTHNLRESKVDLALPSVFCSPEIEELVKSNKKSLQRNMWASLEEEINQFTLSLENSQSSSAITHFSQLANFLTRVKGKGSNEVKCANYLHQMCAYVTHLTRITAPYLFLDTPFSLLSKGWVEIVQKLLFESNVDPEDLELMMIPLNVDLLGYLVQICMPKLPVIPLKQQPGIIILNETKPTKKLSLKNDGCALVSRLLLRLICAMQSDGTNFDREKAAQLCEKEAIQEVLHETFLLSTVDVSAVMMANDSLAFLINLANLMWTHALLVLETKGKGCGLLSKSNTLRDVSSSMVGYNIGGIGFISLGQLHSALIHPCLPPTCLASMSSLLPITPNSDPRTLFAIANAYQLTPRLQVFYSASIERQLELCVADYVKANVELEDKQLVVPIVMQLYLENAILTQKPESEDNLETLSNISREQMSFLYDFLRENSVFSAVDFSGVDVQINEDIEFHISIDYTRHVSGKTILMEASSTAIDNSWMTFDIENTILKYITSRSPLLGMLVQKFHLIDETEDLSENCQKQSYFENELTSDRIESVACVFDNNPIMTVLLTYPDSNELWMWLDTTLQNSDWEKCIQLLQLLPEKLFLVEPKLSKLKDYLFLKMAPTKDGWHWCQSINDIELMAHGVISNVQQWTNAAGCKAALQTLVSKPGLSHEQLQLGRKMLNDVTICHKVLDALGGDDWLNIYRSDCWSVLQKLLSKKSIDLTLEWITMHNMPSTEDELYVSDELLGNLILALLENSQTAAASDILNRLGSNEMVVRICDYAMEKSNSLTTYRAIVTHVMQFTDLPLETKNKYTMFDIGIDMLKSLPARDQKRYNMLISQPMLLVEQLLMCTQLSSLETALHCVRAKLESVPPTSRVSQASLDMVLRNYASRALDVSVCRYNKPRVKVYATRQVSRTSFVIPESPPTKQEWVPDDEVTECMCCQQTVFSMFNRRHHCRRCGRVVCAGCSNKTMKVAGYGDVPVRTCNVCFDYAKPRTIEVAIDGEHDKQWPPPLVDEPEWLLTTDESRNKLIRGEFIYEYAPSVSLCLSILKLHSLDTVQPRFLISKSETMLALLRPLEVGVVNPEIDYALLVQMIRSLILGAKVCYSGLGLSAGMARCDLLLGEVDILHLLVTAHCCHLLPPFPLRSQPAMRDLRDTLIDHELWSLALEVSTKAGLDCGIVWYVWGKTCLKCGNWEEARVKFLNCSLQKKDLQNSGMLADILQILQRGDGFVDLKTRLARLKSEPARKTSIARDTGDDKRVYNECLYYLTKYGSHAQNLEFLVSHGEIAQVLDYTLEKNIDPNTFIENVYLPCLRTARVQNLHQIMLSIDPQLTVWKAHLAALCVWCERRKMLNVLYQVQLWLKDHVRACMTCIRFFYSNARNYSDLKDSVYHLTTAVTHLESAAKQDTSAYDPGIVMSMDKDELNRHVATVKLQIELTSFINETELAKDVEPLTLFGDSSEKSKLAAIVLYSGKDIQQSLALTKRITESYNLQPKNVYCIAAKKLIKARRIHDLLRLQAEFQSNVSLRDEILLAALQEKPQQPETLINQLSNISVKIDAYIECELLKAAYLLAAKHNRLTDIRKVLTAAECLNQPSIKKICLKRLNAGEIASE